MGKPTTQATKPEAAKATDQVTEQATAAPSEQAGVQSATEAAAEEAAATAAAAPKSNLYTVASPIKHDGKDYAAGDQLRLPEATAHRLAGYLKA